MDARSVWPVSYARGPPLTRYRRRGVSCAAPTLTEVAALLGGRDGREGRVVTAGPGYLFAAGVGVASLRRKKMLVCFPSSSSAAMTASPTSLPPALFTKAQRTARSPLRFMQLEFPFRSQP